MITHIQTAHKEVGLLPAAILPTVRRPVMRSACVLAAFSVLFAGCVTKAYGQWSGQQTAQERHMNECSTATHTWKGVGPCPICAEENRRQLEAIQRQASREEVARKARAQQALDEMQSRIKAEQQRIEQERRDREFRARLERQQRETEERLRQERARSAARERGAQSASSDSIASMSDPFTPKIGNNDAAADEGDGFGYRIPVLSGTSSGARARRMPSHFYFTAGGSSSNAGPGGFSSFGTTIPTPRSPTAQGAGHGPATDALSRVDRMKEAIDTGREIWDAGDTFRAAKKDFMSPGTRPGPLQRAFDGSLGTTTNAPELAVENSDRFAHPVSRHGADLVNKIGLDVERYFETTDPRSLSPNPRGSLVPTMAPPSSSGVPRSLTGSSWLDRFLTDPEGPAPKSQGLGGLRGILRALDTPVSPLGQQ